MNDGATVWQEDQARRAVRAALEAAGLTLKQASRALGRNDAYLQQYLSVSYTHLTLPTICSV